MRQRKLVIGYRESEQEAVRAKWQGYGMKFDFVDGLSLQALGHTNYICVAICFRHVPHKDVEALRRVRPIPVVVLPPGYSTAQRFECDQNGAAQYIHSLGQQAVAGLGARDNMRRCPGF